ncbi:helix-turn-helix domain-containing protein [Streptomyces sp. NBC_00654]|uniref:PucR family transcriptional regulator n=1 Tax=Streptomyces sp. NBC_00654 TaxID=2975799 RepID=UPI0022532E86|nr:helix-turn-helix domain-containing protein [Streptomyces sp. NBC_00654]MCX4963532.1 helix-turn-helix domain-containing protein [Streptomyces sp. NBC_00654]
MAEPEIPEELLGDYTRILGEVAVTGRRLTREELEDRRALGRRAAEAGHQLRALVTLHLSVTRTDWPRTALVRTEAGTDSVLAAVEQAVDAFAEGFERAQRLTVRREEAARREFIDDLLYGRSDLGRLAERATRFGLRLSRAHAVAVATGPEAYTETDAVPRSVEAALLARFSGRKILLTTKDGRLVCIAPGSQPDVLRYFAKQAHAATDGGQVAVGRPHRGPGGVVHSYDEALEALDLAVRMGLDDPVLYTADLMVFPVLTRDRQAMADLVRSQLGPLQEARGGAEPLLKTLSVYFDSGCVAAEAARRLTLSVRALTYRLERIHQLTGSDPSDPMHRYALQTAVIGARLLDWPAKEL